MRRIDNARHGQTIFQFVVLHGMAAGQHGPGLQQGVLAAAQNVGQSLLGIIFRQRLGKTGHVHGAPGFAPKSVDIGQSIGRRDAAKGERVIDDGREDVHGLHQGLARRHGEHHGVLVTGAASQHPGLQFGRSFGRKTAQKPLQGPWSQLGRSARGAGFFQQLHLQISVRTFHNEQSATFTPTMRLVQATGNFARCQEGGCSAAFPVRKLSS